MTIWLSNCDNREYKVESPGAKPLNLLIVGNLEMRVVVILRRAALKYTVLRRLVWGVHSNEVDGIRARKGTVTD